MCEVSNLKGTKEPELLSVCVGVSERRFGFEIRSSEPKYQIDLIKMRGKTTHKNPNNGKSTGRPSQNERPQHVYGRRRADRTVMMGENRMK